MLIDNVRFFVIQLIIASLQLLNRTQALVVFLLNLVYFIYFMVLVIKKPIFSSKLIKIKMVVLECCVMVLILTITVFSFAESPDFSSSDLYKGIELLSILSILGAIGSEFMVMATNIASDIKNWCSKKKDKKEVFPSKNQPSGFWTLLGKKGQHHLKFQ